MYPFPFASHSPALSVLVLFAGLTMLLVTVIITYRSIQTLVHHKPANSWPRGVTVPGDPAWVRRVGHAHANCTENLPVFASLVFVAWALQHIAIINEWAYLYAAAE